MGRLSRRTYLATLGGAAHATIAGCLGGESYTGRLTIEWVSDTGTDYTDNHHRIATANGDNHRIAIPREDVSGGEDCGIVVVDERGEEVWTDSLPANVCGGHSIADVGVGDLAGDGRMEFFLPNVTGDVRGYDAESGEETFRAEAIDSIGYSSPVVADLGEETAELVVIDFDGNLSIMRPDGTIRWREELSAPAYVSPIVADFTGDGRMDIAVDHGSHPAYVVCFDRVGEEQWGTEKENSSLRWSAISLGSSPAIVTTDRGQALCLNGADGERRWARDIGGAHADVRVGVGLEDVVYAAASDGTVYGLDAADGSISWSQTISADERMVAPALAKLPGSDDDALVGCAYDGTVTVLSVETGEILARRDLGVGVFSPPKAVDLNGDGKDEILLLYEDARAAALSYEAE